MVYFITIPIDDSPLIDAEGAIRKRSLKRHVLLDFVSSASNIKEDKFFLGNENEKDLNITRIRTSFEWLFPKLIVKIPKEAKFEGFKVRYCLLSFLIFVYLIVSIFLGVFNSIKDSYIDESMFTLLPIIFAFIVFTVIEFKLTKRKINQAIYNFGKTM
jgi:hypothetical protein